MKKIIAIVLAFTLLLILFLFTDKKQENLKEETLWKENPDKIIFSPPKNGKDFGEFQKSELIFVRYANFLKDFAFFTVTMQDKESGKIVVYECGYHCKNLFTELSTLKILSAVFTEEGYRKNLNIGLDSSPKLLLFNSDRVIREMFLGNESSNRSRRFFETDGKIYSAHPFIFNRFKEGLRAFRENNVFAIGNSGIKKIEFVSEAKNVKIDVSPVTENGIQKNSYIRISQKKINLDPALGDSLDKNLKNLKIDRYPDEPNGEGILVAEELVKVKEEKKITVQLSNNAKFILKIYPLTNIKEVKLRPIIRQIQDVTESPSYIAEEFYKSIEQDFENISSAEAFVKALPKK